MIQVGILNGYFPYTVKEQFEKIRAIGFNTVQLDLAFKDMANPQLENKALQEEFS